MDEDDEVSRKVGPMLLKVDHEEARSGVKQRISRLKEEIGKLTAQHDEKTKAQEVLKKNAMTVQQQIAAIKAKTESNE